MEQTVRSIRKARRGSTWDDAAIDIDAIAKRLLLTRRATGLNKTNFAKIADIWPNLYGQFENGKRPLTIGAATKICDAHNVSLDWLYRGKSDNLLPALRDANC